MLSSAGAVRLVHGHVRFFEAAVRVAVADAKAMADVRAGDRTHFEVRGFALGDGVRIVDEHGSWPGGLDGIVDRGELLVVDLDQGERLVGLTRRLGGDGGDGVASKASPFERENRLVLDLRPVARKRADVVWSENDDVLRDG